jgi:glyoxylase-like metal-dependent hydrolase (beta-lactamase superfamily II)
MRPDCQPAPFEVLALRYATVSGRWQAENVIGADPHEAGEDLDYFVWVIRNDAHIFVVDTGFAEDAARQRGRTLLRRPSQSLRTVGVDAAEVSDVIITHLHYDHAGTLADFSSARFHVQDRELRFATGRCMCHPVLRHSYDVEDTVAMVRNVYAGRVVFHDGDSELAPGLSLHRIGGHTAGMQVVRVWTRRGWVVLASDAAHLYRNLGERKPFPIVANVVEMMEGHGTMLRLAGSPDHVIPGHDPDVMRRYPPPFASAAGLAARLDVPPICSNKFQPT